MQVSTQLRLANQQNTQLQDELMQLRSKVLQSNTGASKHNMLQQFYYYFRYFVDITYLLAYLLAAKP